MKIKEVKARVIKNSRGENTIEITINKKFKGSAPSGASVGSKEVMAFPKSGVPIGFINRDVNKGLNGMSLNKFKDLKKVEALLFDYDKSKDLHKIGGNTVVALEFALLKAMSKGEVWRLLNPMPDYIPMPVGNVIGGGKHFKGLSTDIQEFLLIPDCERFKDAVMINDYIHKKIGNLLKNPVKTDEGAWTCSMNSDKIFNLINLVSKEASKKFGIDVRLGMDLAANSLFKNGYYYYRGGTFSRNEQIRFVNNLVKKYNLFYVEDPVEENDAKGYGMIKSDLVVGDDLICTNINALRTFKNNISSVIVKPNQIGSLIKAKEVIDFCREEEIECVISHRSGETMDYTIADLSIGWEIPFIKTGIFGAERKAKLNRIIEIEKKMF